MRDASRGLWRCEGRGADADCGLDGISAGKEQGQLGCGSLGLLKNAPARC